MNNKIVYIADPEILAIAIDENNEPLVDIKELNSLKYGPPPECPQTLNYYTKIRKTVYDKLLQAQEKLPTAWQFRLYEGFRTLEVQQILFDEMYALTRQRAPELNLKDLFHETTRLVSPVKNFDGSLNIPAHNTGAAVDVEIIDQNGESIDMGMQAKDWRNVNPDLCNTNCTSISKQAQNNRKFLLDLMLAEGFVNYPTEWWHFSYGDRYWAYCKNMTHAIYGSADFLYKRIVTTEKI